MTDSHPNRPLPLDVLEHAMWDKWANGDVDGAIKVAAIVVPYRHSRLQTTSARQRSLSDLQLVDDDELLARLVEARRRIIDQTDPAAQSAGLG